MISRIMGLKYRVEIIGEESYFFRTYHLRLWMEMENERLRNLNTAVLSFAPMFARFLAVFAQISGAILHMRSTQYQTQARRAFELYGRQFKWRFVLID